MSFLDRIAEANRCDPKHYRPFRVESKRVGFVKPIIADFLRDWPEVFQVTPEAVELSPILANASPDNRSATIAEVAKDLQRVGLTASHWWDEPYAVNTCFGETPLFMLERGAIQAFGVTGYGVHLNGFVRSSRSFQKPHHLKMWIGRRALNKPSAPGQLDQLVAGGQPAGIGLRANLIKECAEEAAIPVNLATQAQAVSVVSYCLETEQGLRPDILYCFDLELPSAFEPRNTDGEVEEFYLWPVEQVLEIVRETTDFKFNCALVIIDFLARHGYLDPEECAYLQILNGLRQRESLLRQFTE